VCACVRVCLCLCACLCAVVSSFISFEQQILDHFNLLSSYVVRDKKNV